MKNEQWSLTRDKKTVERTLQALNANGMTAIGVKSAADAKAKVLELIPEGAEVFTSTSVTLDAIGLAAEINESGKYNPVRDKLYAGDTDPKTKKYLGAAPEWMVGSVHAVTEDGEVLIASNTGSQLPGYSYGADHVVWVVGTNKLVKNLDEGMQRINEYTLPLEADRARKAYGIPEDKPGSFVSKLLVVNRETRPNRITIILVDETLGF